MYFSLKILNFKGWGWILYKDTCILKIFLVLKNSDYYENKLYYYLF